MQLPAADLDETTRWRKVDRLALDSDDNHRQTRENEHRSRHT
jgi:hypothetical protein